MKQKVNGYKIKLVNTLLVHWAYHPCTRYKYIDCNRFYKDLLGICFDCNKFYDIILIV